VKAGKRLTALLQKWPHGRVSHVANLGFVGSSRPRADANRHHHQRSVHRIDSNSIEFVVTRVIIF
jgi:hypothetical protein